MSGDMGDYWQDVAPAMNEASKARRAKNREASAAILSRSGILFESKNGGAHLIVPCGATSIDFWPGTGLWQVRGDTKQRRGVRKLLDYIESHR